MSPKELSQAPTAKKPKTAQHDHGVDFVMELSPQKAADHQGTVAGPASLPQGSL